MKVTIYRKWDQMEEWIPTNDETQFEVLGTVVMGSTVAAILVCPDGTLEPISIERLKVPIHNPMTKQGELSQEEQDKLNTRKCNVMCNCLRKGPDGNCMGSEPCTRIA